jgi:hypothetical protein
LEQGTGVDHAIVASVFELVAAIAHRAVVSKMVSTPLMDIRASV